MKRGWLAIIMVAVVAAGGAYLGGMFDKKSAARGMLIGAFVGAAAGDWASHAILRG